MMLFFDFDGTIVDISGKYHRVFSAFVQLHGGASLSQEHYWQLKRSEASDKEILDAASLSRLNPGLLREYMKDHIEREHFLESDRLFDGAAAVLGELAAKHACYLVSMRRNPPALQRQLQRLQIQNHFVAVLTPQTGLQEGAESAEPLKCTALRQVPISGKSLIIGDSGMDIVTGKKMGLFTCATTTGIRNQSVLKLYQPDFMIRSLQEVTDIIDRISLPSFAE